MLRLPRRSRSHLQVGLLCALVALALAISGTAAGAAHAQTTPTYPTCPDRLADLPDASAAKLEVAADWALANLQTPSGAFRAWRDGSPIILVNSTAFGLLEAGGDYCTHVGRWLQWQLDRLGRPANTTPTTGQDQVLEVENVTGGSGDDTITGSAGANLLDGGTGADVLDGDGGADAVTYASRTGKLNVSLGDDQPNDGAVATTDPAKAAEGDRIRQTENVIAGAGNDEITGSSAANQLLGGAGADTIKDSGSGADTIDGGSGVDSVDYTDHTGAVAVSLDDVANDGAASEADNVLQTENVTTGGGNDAIIGSDAANRLDGGLGTDAIDGKDGTDTVTYDSRGTSVAVRLESGTGGADTDGNGVSSIGEERDTLVAVESAIGGNGADTLTATSHTFVYNFLSGGPGSDAIDTKDGTLAGDAIDCGDGTQDVWDADRTDTRTECADAKKAETPIG